MVSTTEPHATILPATVLPEPETRAPKIAPGSNRRLVVFLNVIALFAVAGIAFALWLRTVPAGNADPRLAFNVFFFLFARNEPLGLFLVALFSIIAAIFFRRGGACEDRQAQASRQSLWTCVALAAVTFVIAAIGTQVVFHDYAVTADEYLADFQARIFLSGTIQAQVPAQFVDAVRVIKPTFIEYFPVTHLWNATYLPVYAAMRALFQYVDLQELLNPLLAALTVFALYGTARNVWPNKSANALAAIVLLATSSQFLLMAMTSYAMPAHLALNSVWLWFYSRPTRRAFYLAPLIGVLAIGLHQPFPHLLFAAPFLLRLVRDRRWREMSIFAAIYGIGCIGWLIWRAHFQTPLPGGTNSVFRLWNPRMLIVQPMNLLLVIGWASLATPFLAVLGFRRFFRLPPFLQDCALSCLLTFGFYFFFYLDQAHGWGYRYFHGALGCLVLVAVAGWNFLSENVGIRRANIFLAAGAIISLLVQFPLRCFQAENFVRPFATAAAMLHAIPTQTVALDARDAWYSADLIRNDPLLQNRPLIVSIYGLTPQSIAALQKIGSVRFIDRETLTRMGMFTERREDYKNDPFTLGRGR